MKPILLLLRVSIPIPTVSTITSISPVATSISIAAVERGKAERCQGTSAKSGQEGTPTPTALVPVAIVRLIATIAPAVAIPIATPVASTTSTIAAVPAVEDVGVVIVDDGPVSLIPKAPLTATVPGVSAVSSVEVVPACVVLT